MGSSCEALYLAPPDTSIDPLLEEVERLEQCWSRFRNESELSLCNANSEGTVSISSTLYHALSHAQLAYTHTHGLFDPTQLTALERAGYTKNLQGTTLETRSYSVPLDQLHTTSFPLRSMMHEVRISADQVQRPAGVRFDLGGIGKGLAADHLANLLLGIGAQSVVVSMGGDVRVAGEPPPDGWELPVQNAEGIPVFHVRIFQGALAASSTNARKWNTNDGWKHHLIDPRTSLPATSGVVMAVVAASETWWAESLAKACIIAGRTNADTLLAEHGAQGWIQEANNDDLIPIGCHPQSERQSA